MTPLPLADHIAAILADPQTSAGIYDALAEAVLELTDRHRAGVLDPSVLRVALPLALDRDAQTASPADPEASPLPPGGAGADAFARHADLIANLLEAEATPEVLHTMLDEFCTELSNQCGSGNECVCSPAMVRRNFPAILRRAAARGFHCPAGGVMLQPKGADAKGGDL